jgi:Transglutaminase-like superfamily
MRPCAERRRPVSIPNARRLRASERLRLAGEITLAYVDARRSLRREPIEIVVRRLRAVAPRAVAPPERQLPAVDARRLGRAVSRTLHLLPGDTRCLVRSLVLTRLLARRGIASTLVIGTRTKPEFLAHAWVELQGTPLLDSGGGSFARLTEL